MSRVGIILILVILAGCLKPAVNYNEMSIPPSAKITGNELFLKCGSSNVASASYVVPHAKIKKMKSLFMEPYL